jgi:hypothetical protein
MALSFSVVKAATALISVVAALAAELAALVALVALAALVAVPVSATPRMLSSSLNLALLPFCATF